MTPSAVVSVGVFDGLHLGHRAVIDSAFERAAAAHSRLVVYTFDPAPDTVLRGSSESRLTLSPERTALLRQAGVDEVRVLRFSRDLAGKSPEAFLREHVFPFYRMVALVVGHDFAMGRDRAGTIVSLGAEGRRVAFEVEAIPAAAVSGEVISSTGIKKALAKGDMKEVASWLGRPYGLGGTVVSGDGRGGSIGFPTANLRVRPEKVLPGGGVYAVRVTGAGLSGVAGALNLGKRPTFGKGEERAEVHVLDFEGSLVGERLELEVVARLRSETKFNNVNELRDQIEKDVALARTILS